MTTAAPTDARRRSHTRRRLAAAAAIGATFLAYGLLGPATAAHADSVVTDATELTTDVNSATAATTITLGNPITVTPSDPALVVADFPVTIDLAGNDLTVTAPTAVNGIDVPSAAELTITDSVGGGNLAVTGGASPLGGSAGEGSMCVASP